MKAKSQSARPVQQVFCKGGKHCKGLNITCFACSEKGHFQGAEVCKKKSVRKKTPSKSSRRLKENTDSGSTSQSEASSSESENEDSNNNKSTRRVLSRGRKCYITACRRVGRSPEKKSDKKWIKMQKSRKHSSDVRMAQQRKKPKALKYEVEVVINGHKVKGFADTGAEVNIMSTDTAKRLRLPLRKTRMRIRPYGSRSMRCRGCYTGTVMYDAAVTNVKIYVIDKPVETLLSGPACEQLGIIRFCEADVYRTEIFVEDKQKKSLQRKYPILFNGVGTLKGHQVKLHVDDSIRPVCQPARPIPFHLRDKCEQELREMERAGIIEEHEGPSPWVSNLVLAPKDDGGTRVTVDMREPNKAIIPTNIPIIRPEEVKAQFSKYKIFSKLDFRSAFHQLELDEESRKMTVFHAGGRLMRYARLTMGCTPASGELSGALRPLFAGMEGVHVIHDDVIVGGSSKIEHDQNLNAACAAITAAGMTLNLKKCIIGKSNVPWFGMIIGENGIMPDPEKVEALRYMKAPKNKDEVQSFLCMINSHKDFIPFLSRKTSNIRELTHKHKKFRWTKECQKEFEALCKEMGDGTLLQHYDPAKQTYIMVDAHKSGISAILTQGQSIETALPVAYASRATTAVERRYPQLDIEALSVDYGLRRFRFYLAGGPEVKVVTDHKPLESIFRNSRSGSIRTERIKLRHQDIKYQVVWRKGKENPADYLSRHATPLDKTPRDQRHEAHELEKTVWFLNFSPYTEAVSMDSIIEHTNEDKVLQELSKAVKKGFISKKNQPQIHETYNKILQEITISDAGLLLRGEKIILPSSLIERAIKKAHQGSHPGMSCMKRRLRAHFWFPKMDTIVEKFVNKCKECAIFTNKKVRGHMVPQQSSSRMWDKVHLDLFGPMPDSRHVLVATDAASRFPAAKLVKDTSAKTVLPALDQIYTDFGRPTIHRTDNGPPFNSKAFTEYSDGQGITHVKIFPYHPQANNAETFRKPLGKTMKVAHYNLQDKQEAINQLLTNYRATPHSSTGIAPGDMLFRDGYKADYPHVSGTTEVQVRDAIKRDQEQREKRCEMQNQSKYRQEQPLTAGDTVITRNNSRSTKFEPIFDPNPCTVETTEPGGAICLTAEGSMRRRHIDDIKPTSHTSILGSDDTSQTPPQQLPRRSARERKPVTRYGDPVTQ